MQFRLLLVTCSGVPSRRQLFTRKVSVCMQRSSLVEKPPVTPSVMTGTGEHATGLLDRVMAYENPDLVARLRSKLDLSAEDAKQLFEDTKRFLFLCGTVRGQWSPTELIDEGWHNFILFTKDYAEFCQLFFGRFIHHDPKRIGVPSIAVSPMGTLAAARKIFGGLLSKNWAPDAMRTSAECSKSQCNCSPDTGGGGSECTPDSGD